MKRAFTLIELLVVITIISVLMAMTLPALRRARLQVWETECKANLRQMAIGLKTYTNEQDGLFPNPRQTKRVLNIFRLLQQVALEREKREKTENTVSVIEVAWPLLAKAVLIQTQWPELYRLWRHRPTLMQTLEEEYTRKPVEEDVIVRGSAQ